MPCYRLPDGTFACGMLPLTTMEQPYTRKGYIYGEYICEGCAKAEGCTWPDGHVATFNCEYPCGYCGKRIAFDEGGVCATSDWNFPAHTPRGMDTEREL